MAITNKHVVSKQTNKDYEYSRGLKQYIRNCGHRRFQQLLDETLALLAEKLGDARQFAEQLAELLAERPEAEDVSYNLDLKYKEEDFQRAASDVGILDEFLKLLSSTWSDPLNRIIAWLDWAPKIANNSDPRRYTRDIAVMTLEKAKFVKNFKGNFVYLGAFFLCLSSFFFSSSDVNINFSWQVHPRRDHRLLLPHAAKPPVFEYPKNHLFRLLGCVDAAGLSNPYFLDKDNNPCFTVAKEGQATDLTFGRQSELEAYTCRNLESES